MAKPDASPDLKKRLKASASQRFQVTAKEREFFISNLALLLQAAVPVGEALESLQNTSRSQRMKRCIAQIARDIEEGVPLHQALESSGIVSRQSLSLIRLGEESGHLIANMQVAAQQEEKQRILRAKVRSAMLYPAFVVGITVIIGLAVAWFLLPRLSETFAQLHIKLPLVSRIFIGFGAFLKHNGIWAVPLIFGTGILLIYLLFMAPKTRHIGMRLAFHIPGVSRLLQETEIARFGYLLGTLLQSGLSVTQSLRLLQDATGAPRYRDFYRYLFKSFDEGYSFKASIANYKHSTKLLPAALQQMIIAGERSGSLPDTLTRMGNMYEKKADITTQNLEVILEPILLIIIWGGVMAVAIAVILPIYSLVGGLNGGTP